MEIKALKKLDSPHILKLYESFEDDKYLYLVMELLKGGDLIKTIEVLHNKKNYDENHEDYEVNGIIEDFEPFSEKVIARYFKQILEAILWVHKNGLCHRDIKPDNFVFDVAYGKERILKLVDFGFSCFKVKEYSNTMKKELTNLGTDCGTLSFKAPEILVPNRHYTSKVDVWAAGLILIILLTGDLPVDFLPRDKPIFKVIEYIRKCDAAYITENERFDNISEEAKDLVEKMLCKDENQRLTVEECLNHKWFELYSSQDSNPKELSNVLINLKNFKNKSEFKKIILNYLVSQQKIKFNENTPQLFKDIDKDKDGKLIITSFLRIKKTKLIYLFLRHDIRRWNR